MMSELTEEKERWRKFLENTYMESKLGKMINRPSPTTPRESRRYSLDGQELIYILWMQDVESPNNGWRCIASDYNIKQITSLQEYIEHNSKEMGIMRYKYEMECVCGTEHLI